jgi:serine/threonine protein kinase
MELCQLNLGTYISGKWTPTLLEKVPHLTVEMPPKTKIRNAMFIMMQIAIGVSHIHRQGEVHRDLKPSNGTYT